MLHGLEHLRRRIQAGEFPDEQVSSYFDIRLSATELGDEGALHGKQCSYQISGLGGLECAVAEDNKPMTTRSTCDRCRVPDSRIVCDRLAHPRTHLLMGVGLIRSATALCDIGQPDHDIQLCIPGGKECWRQEVVLKGGDAVLPPDLADRLVDELDFINLVFKDRHRNRVINISQARSVADLAGPCENEEAFTHKLAVLGDLMSQFDLTWAFPEGVPRDERGQPLKPIAQLEMFLKEKYPFVVTQVIKPLRRINRIRNTYPVHSATADVLALFESLGISYPILNWDIAWNKVLHNYLRALRTLRQTVQFQKEVQYEEPEAAG